MSLVLVFWIAAAVLLSWWLGGYNRLVRLRAQVISTFAPVDQRMVQALDMLARGAEAIDEHSAATDPDPAAEVAALASPAGLAAAAAQLALSLQAARKQPLDAKAVEALRTAYATLHAVWQHQPLDSDADDPDARLVVTPRAWEGQSQLTREAVEIYNQSVLAYNAAIAQFPAVLLAFLFRFQPAACL